MNWFALYVYCQIPFAKTKANNPEVIKLARLIGRTPSSVARKLGNFGAFDPMLAAKGVSGLTHGSNMDRKIWDHFYGRWDLLVDKSQAILGKTEAEPLLIAGRPGRPSNHIPPYRANGEEGYSSDEVVSVVLSKGGLVEL